jgi:hypothetical protein
MRYRQDRNRLGQLFQVFAVTIALFGSASVGHAQTGRQLVFDWRGRVDRETHIEVSGDNRIVRGIGGTESDGEFLATSPLPAATGPLTVDVVAGRGTVDIMQQPAADNNYVGIIRIRDADNGAAMYHIRVYRPGSTTHTETRIETETHTRVVPRPEHSGR